MAATLYTVVKVFQGVPNTGGQGTVDWWTLGTQRETLGVLVGGDIFHASAACVYVFVFFVLIIYNNLCR